MSAPRHDLVTLGETMLRMAPPAPLRLGQSASLDISFGGAESTVAANLARLGRRTAWLSRVPDTPLGQQLAETLRAHGVDTAALHVDSDARLGTYYVEQGTTPRGIRVWYDRKHSAASQMQPHDIPAGWIEGARWLHLTGITPALSASCHATTAEALRRACAAGVRTSFDVNYRALLWSAQAAADTLAPFCEAADVVLIARRDAAGLFGITGELADVTATLQRRWGGAVIVTDGAKGAAAHDGTTGHHAAAFPAQIVDRLGAGDAFASGVIDRLLDDAPLTSALRFGAALAALKLSVAGDIALTNRAEVEQIMQQDTPSLKR